MTHVKRPIDEHGWPTTAIISKRPLQSKEADNLRILQRIVGETLTVASHPEGFLKGVEARVDELDRAKRTNEAEKILIELVAASTQNSIRKMAALEKAKNYLQKRGIHW
jgi:hypothetical protein